MARNYKPAELKPLDNPVQLPVRPAPLRLPISRKLPQRTFEPGIDVLLDQKPEEVPMENQWGAAADREQRVPWAWFSVIFAIIATGVIWSLFRVKHSDVKAEQIRTAAETITATQAKDELDAEATVEKLERAAAEFFKARTIDELKPLIRQPERVGKLMQNYYETNRLSPASVKKIDSLMPITVDQQFTFWIAIVSFTNGEPKKLLLNIDESGQAKVDWETFVCYQPIPWDTFAKSRPENVSYQFRINMTPDSFYSHEFSDSTQWTCFRLTALNSDQIIYGYAKTGSPAARKVIDLISRNRGRVTAAILQLNIPAGLQSPRGAVIEDFVSPRWLHMDS